MEREGTAAGMVRVYPRTDNLWPQDLKASPGLDKNSCSYTGRNKHARKKQEWERGMKGGGSDHRSECLYRSRPTSGKVVQGLGKDRSLAKVCFTSILFLLTSGNKQFSQSFRKHRMGIGRVCIRPCHR